MCKCFGVLTLVRAAHLDSRVHDVFLRVVGLQDHGACAVEHVVSAAVDIITDAGSAATSVETSHGDLICGTVFASSSTKCKQLREEHCRSLYETSSVHLTTSSKAPSVCRSALNSSRVPGSASARAFRCACLAVLLASRTVART